MLVFKRGDDDEYHADLMTETASNETTVNSNDSKITMIDSVGNRFEPVGDWRMATESK